MGIIIKQSIKSSVYAYIGIILGFITTALLMPKILSESEVGLTRLLVSITLPLSHIATLGYNGAGGRLFPYFRNHEKQHHGYLFWGCVITLTGLCLCLGTWVYNHDMILRFLNAKASPLLNDYLFYVIPLTVFYALFFIFDNYARVLYDTTSGTFLKEFAQRVFIFIAIVIYALHWIDFKGFVIAYVVALCLPTILLIIRVWQKDWLFLKPVKGFWTPQLKKDFFKLSTLTFLSGFTSQIVLSIDQIQVTSIINLAANGVYSTMMMFGTVIFTPTIHINRIGGTIIAEAWKTNDLKTIRDVYEKSCLTLPIVGCLLFIGIVTNLPNVFEILPNYETGKWVVIWIGIGKIFDMATGLNGTILQLSKYYFYDTLFMVFLILGTWLMNQWLIPQYGITGSAIATTVMIFAFNVFRTIFVWIAFGLMPFSLKNLYIFIIAGIVFLIISNIPKMTAMGSIPSFLIDTPLRSVLTGLLFMGAIYGFKISSDVNTIIDGIWQKIFKR